MEMLDNRLEGWFMVEIVLGDHVFTILHNLDLVFMGSFARGHGEHGPFTAGIGLAIAVDLMPRSSGCPGAGHLSSIKVSDIVGEFGFGRLYTIY
jgi:hypothetical protein